MQATFKELSYQAIFNFVSRKEFSHVTKYDVLFVVERVSLYIFIDRISHLRSIFARVSRFATNFRYRYGNGVCAKMVGNVVKSDDVLREFVGASSAGRLMFVDVVGTAKNDYPIVMFFYIKRYISLQLFHCAINVSGFPTEK